MLMAKRVALVILETRRSRADEGAGFTAAARRDSAPL